MPWACDLKSCLDLYRLYCLDAAGEGAVSTSGNTVLQLWQKELGLRMPTFVSGHARHHTHTVLFITVFLHALE